MIYGKRIYEQDIYEKDRGEMASVAFAVRERVTHDADTGWLARALVVDTTPAFGILREWITQIDQTYANNREIVSAPDLAHHQARQYVTHTDTVTAISRELIYLVDAIRGIAREIAFADVQANAPIRERVYTVDEITAILRSIVADALVDTGLSRVTLYSLLVDTAIAREQIHADDELIGVIRSIVQDRAETQSWLTDQSVTARAIEGIRSIAYYINYLYADSQLAEADGYYRTTNRPYTK